MKSELLIGAGNSRDKRMHLNDDKTWHNLRTLDVDERTGCDIIHDLNNCPWPIVDGEFQEVHAYEVLEHLGTQGDYRGFFKIFSEIHRVLAEDGLLFASVPRLVSPWAWGDPGHTRIINLASITFLNQAEYEKQVGVTSMTDYRDIWKGHFVCTFAKEEGDSLLFVLQKQKYVPSTGHGKHILEQGESV